MASDLSLAVVLGATLAGGFKGVFGDAGKSVGQLGATVKATHAQLNDVKAYQRTESALDETRAKLGETVASVRGLKQAMAGGDTSPKLAKQLKTTEGNALKLSSALEAQKAKLREQGDALRKSGVDTKNLGAVSERLTRTFEQQKATLASHYALMEKRRHLVGELRSQWVKLAGAVLVARKAIGNAVDFETAMAGVKQAVTFDTPQQFQQMSGDVEALSRRLGVASGELAGLVKDGGELALPRAELVGFAEDSAKLGVAFGLTAHDAGQAIGQWRAAFGLTEKQAVQTADVIGVLGRTTGANAAQLTQFTGELGAAGDALGFTAGQIAALTGSMVQVGATTTNATMGVKSLMTTLGAGRAATDQQRAAFAALGIDADKLAERMQTDAAGGVVALMNRLKQLPQAARMEVLQNLVGKKGIATIAPLINNVDKLRENLRLAGDASKSAGEMQRRFDEQNQTTAATLARGRESWNTLTRIIGNVFTPVLRVVVGAFVRATDVIKRASDEFPRLTAVVVGAAAGFLTFNAAVTGLKLIGTFLPSLRTLGGLARALVPGLGLAQKGIMGIGVAMRGLSLAALANPVGIIIGAIVGAVVVGALLVRKYWEPIKAFFAGLWDGLRDAAGPTLATIGAALAPLKPAWDGIVKVIGVAVGWFKSLLQPVQATKQQLDAATNAGRFWGDVLGGVFNVVAGSIGVAVKLFVGLGEAIGTVAGMTVVGMGNAADAVSGAWNGAIDFIGGLWDGLKAKIAAVVDWVTTKIEWVANKWQTLKGLPGAVWGDIKQAGAAIGSTLAGPAMATAGGPAFALPAPASRGGMTDNSTHTTTIQVTPSPGMDERALAQQVRRELDDRDRAQAARRRSTLGDLD